MTESDGTIEFLVINLDSQVDRWNNCVKQAEFFGFRLIRVPAMTPPLPSHVTKHYVTDGVRAVWESHMQCLRYFSATNSHHLLIMEDDFEILDFKKLDGYLRDPRVLSYDLVQLGFLTPGLDTRLKVLIANMETLVFRLISFFSRIPLTPMGKIQDRLRVKEVRDMPWGFTADDFQPGAHCYLISRELAKATLELNSPQFLCIDDFFTAFSQMRSFKSMRVRKSLVAQAPFAKWEGDRFLS